jgi:hypothetical protein
VDEPGGARDTDDVVALWRLQSAYADCVTRRAWPEVADLFLPDAEVELDLVTSPLRTIVGPADLASFIEKAIERFDHFAFVILNTVVDVAPPPAAGGPAVEATGRIFMCEIRHDREAAAGSDGDGWSTAYGLYRDRYRWVDGRWWIAGRRYRSLARQGPQTTILGLPDDLR